MFEVEVVMDPVELCINEAIELKKNNRLEEAISACSEALDYLLLEARNYANKTVGYIDGGGTSKIPQDYSDAVRSYLRRDKKASDMSNNVGILFAQLEDFESAKKWFEQAAELYPEGAEYHGTRTAPGAAAA